MKINHLIYGTFPDLPGSQQVVFKSAGVTPELESKIITFYNEFGDCRNEEFKSSTSVCWMEDGSIERYAVLTKVSHAGRDFSGRWGALLRHSAVLNLEQFRALLFDPSLVVSKLVSSGTAEELAKSGDLEIASPENDELLSSQLLSLNFDHYKKNLAAILNGSRLAFYSDTNNEFTNRYLADLIGMLPFMIKEHCNWSEFVFKPSDDFDICFVYSSRYEAPAIGIPQFVAVGENVSKTLSLREGYADDFMEKIEHAYSNKDPQLLREVLQLI